MDEQERNARLCEIASRFGWVAPTGLITAGLPPIDISKPNLHDSKVEFLEEKQAVDTALEQANSLIRFIVARYREEQPQHTVSKRVCKFIDASARAKLNQKPSETIIDMIQKNAVDHNLSVVAVFLLIELERHLSNRKQELADQESVYWSKPNRPPNHYARTIALRFAKLVARNTGARPTFGTSRDGGHPSTEFGRALEELFKLLDIQANVRHPAKWAIEQLAEDDLKPEPLGLLPRFGMGLGFGSPPPGSSLDEIADALTKAAGH